MVTLKSKLVWLVLLLPLLLMANQEKADQLMREISTRYETIETFEADFTQANSWAAMDSGIESNGKIYYDQSNLIMRYQAPEVQIMKVTDEEITVFSSTSNQMMISKNNDISLKPLELLKQYWDISTIYLQENTDGYKVKLQYEGGRVEANIIDSLIYDIILYDVSGNSVKYHFSNMKINKELPENIFQVEVDDSVEILDMSK